MPSKTERADRSTATRETILAAAERLFAEHGVAAVSNRQISEAAGQGNNAAVNYHFGTKTDLVRAIVRIHHARIEEVRTGMVAEAADSTRARDWVACLVRPTAEHLANSGTPTWYARFGAQLMTDPTLRELITEESMTHPALVATIDGLNRCLPSMPADVRAARGDMARTLIVHMTAERERSLASGLPTHWSTWQEAATSLIDAIIGLLYAPVTQHEHVEEYHQ